jgi:Intracellular proteinase inhibitor
MSNRLIIPLLCAASVAFFSGSSSHKETAAKTPIERHHHKDAGSLASSFAVNVRNGVQFSLDVRNNTSRMVELRFPSGMTHDFVVLDESGREVWRLSSGKMFTQTMQNKLIKSRDNAVFADSWAGRNMHGKFTAVAILPSENHPVEEKVEFALR